jgi:glycosyltransferase involved in cell wall biosynthesis
MKTICVDARMYLASGIGTYLRNILKALFHEGSYFLQVIVSKEIIEKVPEIKQYNIIVANSSIYTLKEQFELPLKVMPCDLFWSPNFNVPLLPVRAKKRIVTIHDVFYLAHSESLPFHKKHYARIVTKKAAQGSDFVITDSDFSKNEICKYTGVSISKIKTIHLGVDPLAFSRQISTDESSDIQIKYKPPQKYILYVGNLKAHKNILKLIEAYKLWVKLKGTDIHLVLIGKHFPEYPVKKEIEKDPQLKKLVHFYTTIENSELQWFYSNAVAAIQPSLYEGFGFPPLEAMSCGCPTIVSTAASLPEICGDAPYYIDPNCIKSMVKGLEKIIENEIVRKSLSEKGYQRVKEFQWKKAFEEHMQVFEQVMHTP